MTFEQFEERVEQIIGTRTTSILGISNIARMMDGLIFLGGPNLQRYDGTRRYSFCSKISFSPFTHLFFCIDFGRYSTELANAVQRLDPTRINNCKILMDETGLFVSTSGEINTGAYTFNPQIDVRINAETFIFFTNGDVRTTTEVINWIRGRFSGAINRISPEGAVIPAVSQSTRQYPLNQILYGPPGTGKSHNAINHALAIIRDYDMQELIRTEKENALLRDERKREFDDLVEQGKVQFVTFHQSYSYEEFVEGIKIKLNSNNDVYYEVEDGIFKKMCTAAINDPDNNYVLIIDEINRGNISKIFGELITLIEPSKRLGNTEQLKIKLTYSGANEDGPLFGVPKNLYLVGTMNSADKSIALIDVALRRRFTFFEYNSDPSYLSENVENINLKQLLQCINSRVEFLLDRDHLIGHAYLIDVTSKNKLCEVFRNKLIPLLKEYFYNDLEKIRLVLGDHKNWKQQSSLYLISTEVDIDQRNIFGKELDGFEDKELYSITKYLQEGDFGNVPPEAFTSIYDKDVQIQSVEEPENS